MPKIANDVRVADCPHRGREPVAVRTADVCGLRGVEFDVFACELHRRCALHRFCRRQPEMSCAVCIATGKNRLPLTISGLVDEAIRRAEKSVDTAPAD